MGRSAQPVLQPIRHHERHGFVPNVVFPTAMLDLGDNLQIFYGAADACVASVQLSKQSVLDSLERNPHE
ncbi:glycoside hydrolase family 130 protein [Rhodopirellula europaea]|uniref:Glycosylase n=1 Tax=Rhodopirellula europaea SH398 TaxID=1263868 RepID=M5SAT0_9BACT|nr:glycosylase [Rhodopirellula europaea]EMI28590.1 glycosylase [Rhodopirellula europaea SH398]